jgi:hypothetical protein
MGPRSARRWASYGAFYIGLALIVASAALNIAYDRLSELGPEALPGFLTQMYETTGKLGVTITFVTAGMTVIALGFAFQGSFSKQRSLPETGYAGSPMPYYSAPDGAEGEAQKTSSGGMVLRTRKYLPE